VAYSWGALAFAWLSIFASGASNSVTAPILIFIRNELSFGHAEAGLLLSAPMAIVATLGVFAGSLSDRVGVRKSIGVGLVIISLANFLSGIAPDYNSLLLSRIIIGLGAVIMLPSLPKMVRAWFPARMIGLATGIYTTGLQFGFTVSLALTIPFIMPWTLGWRGVFFFWSGLGAAVLVLWSLKGRDLPPQDAPMPAVGEASPVKGFSVWRERSVLTSGVLLFLNSLVFTTAVQWLPTYFLEKGVTPDVAAATTSLITAAAIPTVFLVPILSDRLGVRKPFLYVSTLGMGLATTSFLLIPTSLSSLPVAVLGMSTNSQFVVVYVLMAELTAQRYIGRVAGLIMSMSFLAGLVGPILAGLIREITGDFFLMIVYMMVISLGSLPLVALIRETGVSRGQVRSKVR
jgi:CP family cyanate transporter-like MFS transporter